MFKLPRKKKKKYKKDDPFFNAHWTNADNATKRSNYEWFYNRRKVEIRSMLVILDYPRVVSKEELSAWYLEKYPNDTQAQHITRQL